MLHSPPATRANTDKMEAKLKEEVRGYHRVLQKISKTKTKILCAPGTRSAEKLQEFSRLPPKIQKYLDVNVVWAARRQRRPDPVSNVPGVRAWLPASSTPAYVLPGDNQLLHT